MMATPPVIARARSCRRHENVRLGFLFIFRGSPVDRENRENWLPRKFQGHKVFILATESEEERD